MNFGCRTTSLFTHLSALLVGLGAGLFFAYRTKRPPHKDEEERDE